MSPRESFSVAVRVVGLVASLLALFGLSTIGLFMMTTPLNVVSGDFFVLAGPSSVLLGLGVWLLRGAPWLVDFAFGELAAKRVVDRYAGRAILDEFRAAGRELPASGNVLLSMHRDQAAWTLPRAAALVRLGYELVAEGETLSILTRAGVPVKRLHDLPGHPASISAALEMEQLAAVFCTRGEHALLEEAKSRGVLSSRSPGRLQAILNGLAALHEGEQRAAPA